MFLKLNINKQIRRNSSAFTLLELLVVVAVLGIISAIGVVSYTGYTESSRNKSTENIMQQIALAQTEYLSDIAEYYQTEDAPVCVPTEDTSTLVETELLGGQDIITADIDHNICIVRDPVDLYIIIAQSIRYPTCTMQLTGLNVFTGWGEDCKG